jgi:hypothetical protein
VCNHLLVYSYHQPIRPIRFPQSVLTRSIVLISVQDIGHGRRLDFDCLKLHGKSTLTLVHAAQINRHYLLKQIL